MVDFSRAKQDLTHHGVRKPGDAPATAVVPKLPPGRVERTKEDGEVESFEPLPDFEAREGDVLVVGYPEVTIPLKQYSSCKVGGLIYTRKMREGESVAEQMEKVYRFLEKRAEADARSKVRKFAEELRGV